MSDLLGSSKRVLDPIDRVSEILFGLIMVLSFTGSLSVAVAGRTLTLGARKALTVLRIHEVFKHRVATSIPAATKSTGLTAPTVASAIDALQKLGIVREVTAKQRNRQFLYSAYLATLEDGGERNPSL